MSIDILDTTLRDGSYAVGFQLTTEDACFLSATLDRAGIPFIEVGHGWGVDVLGQLPHESLTADEALPPFDEGAYFKTVRAVVKHAKLGAPLFASSPGVTLRSLDILVDSECDFVRVLTHPEELGTEKVRAIIARAKKCNLLVAINILKTYAYGVHEIADTARRAEDLGADWFYVVDSAGGMLPDDVKRYVGHIREASRFRIGFHGHDNLHMSVANVLAAIEAGASLVDGSLQGLGRATGNPSTEHLAVLLESRTKPINRRLLFASSRSFVRPIVESGFEPAHLLSGAARMHSDWLPRIERLASSHGIALDDILIPLGKEAARTAGVARVADAVVTEVSAQLSPTPHALGLDADLSGSAPAEHLAPSQLTRIAKRRDRARTAVAFVPRALWCTAGPHAYASAGWTFVWIPTSDEDQRIETRYDADLIARATELGLSSIPGERIFSLTQALSIAVGASVDRARTKVVCSDPELAGALASLVTEIPAPEMRTTCVVAQGAKGRDAVRAALESKDLEHVVLLGQILPFVELFDALHARKVSISIPDCVPAVLALTTTGLRTLDGASANASSAPHVEEITATLWECEPTTQVVALRPNQRVDQATWTRATTRTLELRFAAATKARPRIS